jgi:hypothetical protein
VEVSLAHFARYYLSFWPTTLISIFNIVYFRLNSARVRYVHWCTGRTTGGLKCLRIAWSSRWTGYQRTGRGSLASVSVLTIPPRVGVVEDDWRESRHSFNIHYLQHYLRVHTVYAYLRTSVLM